MKSVVFCILFCFSYTAFAQSIDTSRYAILEFGSGTPFIFPENSKMSSINNAEVDEVEILLKKCVIEYNRNQQKKMKKKSGPIEKYTIILDEYKRQYVAIINSKNEKEVWVNCFCDPNAKDWRKEIIIGKGKCYFDAKFNLKKKKQYYMHLYKWYCILITHFI